MLKFGTYSLIFGVFEIERRRDELMPSSFSAWLLCHQVARQYQAQSGACLWPGKFSLGLASREAALLGSNHKFRFPILWLLSIQWC
jgi:hypothetical protein